MKSRDGNAFFIGRRLTLILGFLIALILGGNGVVILHFEKARLQTDRLMGVSQQLIAVLQFQESLLSFHHRLNELAQSKDARLLVTEAQPLRTALLQRARQTRRTLAYLPAEFRVDPAFQTALNTIEITLPLQLQDISTLATVGDWDAVRIHLDNELSRIETTTSSHVNSLDRDLNEELPVAVANMRNVRRRIIATVPATAISTVLIAAFFGWSVARRMIDLRVEAAINERTRIARELHDNLIQTVTGVALQIGGLSKIVKAPEHAKERLQELKVQLEDCLREARQYVWDIRSPASESIDLVTALRESGEQLTVGKATRFVSAVDGIPKPISADVRQQLLRIGREAIGNAVRHSRATQIEARLRFDAGKICLRISDDGRGFNIDEGARMPGHFGLATMRERAAQIHGCIHVSSTVGQGTCIEVIVPIPG